jgi:TPR repeat protein
LAAWPYDSGRPSGVTGVDWMESSAAEEPCRKALAASPDSARQQFQLSRVLQFKKDIVESVALLQKSAALGFAPAQTNLGLAYALGYGVDKDTAQAARLLRKAADQGDANAQFILGLFLESGRGVARNVSFAVFWRRRAAGQGHEGALRALARLGRRY